MATILKIGGSTIDRRANRIALDRLTISLEAHDVLEFSQVATILPGQLKAHAAVELAIDGATRFRGVIGSTHHQGVGTDPIRVGYRAFGLEWMANRIPITGIDGTGSMQFNLPRTDEGYIPALSGRSVGQILAAVFDQHAAELAAVGVTGYDPADLAALIVVPRDAVHLSGGLWGMVRSLLTQWCNKYCAWIDPADGMIRVKSQLGGLTPLTLTLDADPFTLDSLAEDHSECATRIVLRGGPDVQAAYLTMALDGTIAKGWTGPQEAAWTWADYIQPRDSADVGATTAVGSTTLTVQSDDAARTWAANYWSGVVAEVVAYDPVATGITYSETRRITANTALTAGGTSVLTLDAPLNNSGYTRYSIRGAYSPAAAVWRKLAVVPAYVRDHLVKRFSHDMPWSPSDGATVYTTSPQAVVCYAPGCTGRMAEFPVTFEVNPTDGSLWFHEPIVRPFSSMASLEAGAPDGIPCEVKVMVPYSLGAMSITLPASGHEGTAHTVDGLERTLYRDYPQWLDYRDRASYEQLARELLDTAKDTVIEGSLTYHGKLTAALAKGAALNLARDGGTTGWEAAAATVRSVVLDFAPDGGSASQWITRLQFSNRLKPFSGDRLYAHPGFAGQVDRREIAIDSRQGSHDVGAAMAESQPRPDFGDAGAAADMLDRDWSAPGGNTSGRYQAGREYRRDRDYRTTTEPYRAARKFSSVSEGDLAADRAKARAKREAESQERRKLAAARPDADRRRAAGKDAEWNAVEKDGRENDRRRAARSSRRADARLSHVLGRDSAPADRRGDAMLAGIAAEDVERRRSGSTGIGIAYP